MRLSAEHINKFKECVLKFIHLYNADGACYELRLFGSRLNDKLDGGDFDLLFLLDLNNIEIFEIHQHELVYFIKDSLNTEEKFDLIIVNKDKIAKSAFLQNVFSQSQIVFKSTYYQT